MAEFKTVTSPTIKDVDLTQTYKQDEMTSVFNPTAITDDLSGTGYYVKKSGDIMTGKLINRNSGSDVFFDEFTDTDGTLLETHNAVWIKMTGGGTATINAASSTGYRAGPGTNNCLYLFTTQQSGDFDVTAKIAFGNAETGGFIVNGPGTTNKNGIVFRIGSATSIGGGLHQLTGYIGLNTAGGTTDIGGMGGGILTSGTVNIDSATRGDVDPIVHTFKASKRGNAYSMYFDGVQIGSTVIDTTYTSGYVGVWGNLPIDDFRITLEGSDNLQEWQDHGETVVADIDPTGIHTAVRFVSTTITGVAPITVTSTTKATNLNADYVDSVHVATLTNTRLLRYNSTGTQIENATVTESSGALGSITTISMSSQLTSTLATGTAPFVIASTTKVANLNVDLLDDQSGAYYLDSTNFTGTNWTDLTDGGDTTLHTHSIYFLKAGDTITDGGNIALGTSTGTKIGTATNQKLSFYNADPIVQPTALTTQLTTITHTDPAIEDFAIQDLTQTTPYGFVTQDEGNTVLKVIANLQARVAELETKLEELGLIASN